MATFGHHSCYTCLGGCAHMFGPTGSGSAMLSSDVPSTITTPPTPASPVRYYCDSSTCVAIVGGWFYKSESGNASTSPVCSAHWLQHPPINRVAWPGNTSDRPVAPLACNFWHFGRCTLNPIPTSSNSSPFSRPSPCLRRANHLHPDECPRESDVIVGKDTAGDAKVV